MLRQVSTRDVIELLQELGLLHEGQQMLFIGVESAADENGVIGLHSVKDASELALDIRVNIAVVVGQLERMSPEDGTHLLSRLRDIISERVLLVLRRDGWHSDELRALGYMQIGQQEKRSSIDERLFLFDPDQFNEPRVWNNATNWANPKNFKKFRW